MKNWLGQSLIPGDDVYRGAREGNSSSFKVGTILTINEEKNMASVKWQWEPGWFWLRNDVHKLASGTNDMTRVQIPRSLDYKSTLDVGSLIVVDASVLLDLEIWDRAIKYIYEYWGLKDSFGLKEKLAADEFKKQVNEYALNRGRKDGYYE